MTNGLICKGCLELDELTFDKLVAKFSTVLVKFDIAFPYGKQHDEYGKFAQEMSESNVSDMIVCVVGIKNYGDTTNHQLSERFHVTDRLPAVKLFTNYNTLKWTDFPKGAKNSHCILFVFHIHKTTNSILQTKKMMQEIVAYFYCFVFVAYHLNR